MTNWILLSLNLRAWATLGAFVLLLLQSHFPDDPLLSACARSSSAGFGGAGGVGSDAPGSSTGFLAASGRAPDASAASGVLGGVVGGVGGSLANALSAPLGSAQMGLGSGGGGGGGSGGSGGSGGALTAVVASPLTGPPPSMIKVFGAATEGAFAVLAGSDDDSVRWPRELRTLFFKFIY